MDLQENAARPEGASSSSSSTPVDNSSGSSNNSNSNNNNGRVTWRMDADMSFSDWTIEIFIAPRTENSVPHGTYHVHKNILAVGPKRSEYFEHLFRSTGGFVESSENTSRIDFNELAASAFPIMLDYLYCFSDDFQIEHGNSAGLFHLGEYFGIPSLCEHVETCWQDPAISCSQLGVLYDHAKIFGNEKLIKIVLQACCNAPGRIQLDSELAQNGGALLWRSVIDMNDGEPNANLCALIADYCLSTNGDIGVYKQLRENEGNLADLSNETALKILQLEHRIVPTVFGFGFTGIQTVCIDLLAASWRKLDSAALQDSLAKLHPCVLSAILKASVEQAKTDLVPTKIVVSGAGCAAVNGVYVRCDSAEDAAPKFVMEDGEWDDEEVVFTMQNCKMVSTNWNWFISIADEEQPGTDRDVDFYASSPNPTMLQSPPVSHWKVKMHGQAPPPSFKFMYD